MKSADRFRPFHRKDRIFDDEHRRRVNRFALEDAFVQLALRHQPKQFGKRPCRREALEPLNRAGPKDQNAVRAFAAQHFLPAKGCDIELVPRQVIGEHGAGRIANGQTFAVGRDPVAIGDACAGGRAVPGEDDVVCPIDGRKIGDRAIGGGYLGRIELQLLDDIGHPAFAEAFPCQHRHATRAQHRPERHFDGTGIRARNNADAVGIGHLQHFAG